MKLNSKQRKHRKTKIQFSIKLGKKCNLYQPGVNKNINPAPIMRKYHFGVPLTSIQFVNLICFAAFENNNLKLRLTI